MPQIIKVWIQFNLPVCNGSTMLMLPVSTCEALRVGATEGIASLGFRQCSTVLSDVGLCAAVEVMTRSDVDETDETHACCTSTASPLVLLVCSVVSCKVKYTC